MRRPGVLIRRDSLVWRVGHDAANALDLVALDHPEGSYGRCRVPGVPAHR
jgi:hypothetical protein